MNIKLKITHESAPKIEPKWPPFPFLVSYGHNDLRYLVFGYVYKPHPNAGCFRAVDFRHQQDAEAHLTVSKCELLPPGERVILENKHITNEEEP